MPSAAARSPSRSGPDRSTVDSAASCVGVRPASSCLRSLRDNRAMATRSRVTSITPDPVSIMLTPSADALIVVSRAMHEDYALPLQPRNLVLAFAKGAVLSGEAEDRRDDGAECL